MDNQQEQRSAVGKALAGLLAGAIVATPVIKNWESEGGEPDLTGYADISGVPTDCWGNTHGAVVGVERTVAECEALLNGELNKLIHGLNKCVKREVKPWQGAALISWAYNVGLSAACKSTLVKYLNAGHPPEVWCAQLDRWVYDNGKWIRGLANRRAAERKLCEGGGDAKPVASMVRLPSNPVLVGGAWRYRLALS